MDADPALPGSDVLLGEDAIHVLGVAVESAGGRLLHVRPSQIQYHAGSRLAVRYAATVEWKDGTQRIETLGAVVQRRPLPDGVAVLEDDDGTRIGVWRYPHDPFLPGLPAAAYPAGAQAVLSRLGIPAPEVTVAPLVYRPASRAVLRITAGHRVVYLKVVRPGRAKRLHAVHDSFGAVTTVPRCLASSDPLGLIALDVLPGQQLGAALLGGGAIPPPAAVVDLMDRIHEVVLPTGGRGSTPAPVADHVAALAHAVPDEHERLHRLAATAVDARHSHEHTVHGDFYEAQILVDESGSITGLLDIDGAAQGSATEDPATLIAHLLGMSHIHPAAAGRVEGYRQDIQALVVRRVDPDLLRAAVTGVLLGLATTPFRRQDEGWAAGVRGWLGVAEQWSAGG